MLFYPSPGINQPGHKSILLSYPKCYIIFPDMQMPACMIMIFDIHDEK